MCVESTENAIGTGQTSDTGDEVYNEPADEEMSDDGDSTSPLEQVP